MSPLIIELLFLAALVVPFVIWLHFCKTVKTIYQGKAVMDWKDRSFAKDGTYYAFFKIPGLKQSLMAKIPLAKFDAAMILSEYSVVVKKRPLSEAWVDQVAWQEGKFEKLTPDVFPGLWPGLYYLALAFGIGIKAGDLHLGHVGYLTAALALAFAGLTVNLFRFTPKDVSGAAPSLLGIKFGRGIPGLIVSALVFGAITVACFWQPSIFMMFPGINCAFAFGGIVSILFTAVFRPGDDGEETTKTAA